MELLLGIGLTVLYFAIGVFFNVLFEGEDGFSTFFVICWPVIIAGSLASLIIFVIPTKLANWVSGVIKELFEGE